MNYLLLNADIQILNYNKKTKLYHVKKRYDGKEFHIPRKYIYEGQKNSIKNALKNY